MFLCMRTTIDIPDDILQELKRLAAETQRSLKDVFNDFLRSELERRKSRPIIRTPERVITFKGNGVRPGVHLDSSRDLLDIMDGDG